MCGRLTMTSGDYEAIATSLEASIDPRVLELARPRYNAGPGDELGVLLLIEGERKLVSARWGFHLPPRDGDRSPSLLINARAESLIERPTFRRPTVAKTLTEGGGRCLVPSDGFFEWSGPKGARQPHWFHRPDRALLPFAGLVRREGDHLVFVIITQPADDMVAKVHHRMPAMLTEPASIQAWLDGDVLNRGESLEHWFGHTRPRDLREHPVSNRANDTRFDGPELLEPVEPPKPPPKQVELFGGMFGDDD